MSGQTALAPKRQRSIDKQPYNWKKLGQRIWRSKHIYLMLLPGVLFFAIFRYIPIYGIQLAFKKYAFNMGITGSPWVGLDNFRLLFLDGDFWQAVINTLIIAYLQILVFFPFPVVLAILLNEIRVHKYKRTVQTIYTFPHFLSWVIVSGMVLNMLASAGAINNLLNVLGFERVHFLTNKDTFRQLLVIVLTWKESGWSCILYLAAITAIDPTLYEAAVIDGANRWHKMRYITLPGISMIVVVTLILRIGHIMDAGFEQILNIYNPSVYAVADIIDTYIYRITFQRPANFGLSTSVGLFKGITNCVLLLSANWLSQRIGQTGIL
ncbi:MAG: ABC transporter permease subunit [Oscillospiraceae bacterium]|nr:ABC transporter permease subunit [Oscillospiraceae bacterium]